MRLPHVTPLADVKGKVAFITGGSSGIGLGMARAFSAADLENEVAKPSTNPPSPEEEAMMRKFMAAAMDPVEAGRLVLEGVRRNDLYIFTHQEFEQPTRERTRRLQEKG